MKSIFAADVAVLRSESKLSLLLPLAYMCMGVYSTFFRVFSVILIVGQVISIMAYNERSGFDRELLLLPMGRRKVVLTRYVEAIVLPVAMLMMQMLLSRLVRLRACPPMTGTEFLLMLGVIFLYVGILFPFIFKLSVEKGRTAYLLLMMAAMGLSMIAVSEEILPAAGAGVQKLSGLILLAAGAVSLPISCKLGIRFYEQREF